MELGADPGWGTLLAHFGEEEKTKGAVVPPLFQNSLFLFDDVDELHAAMAQNPAGPPYTYSRIGNPTVELAEKKLAELEGTEACRLVGSGMAAITVAILSCVKSGSHVVMVDTCYGPARQLVGSYLDRFGVTYTLVNGGCLKELEAAIRPETTLIFLEAPTSLMFRMQDVAGVVAIARKHRVATAIDNTYCTPLLFNPASLGVDLVIHSGTKYLGGHSDLTAGAVCASRERIDAITLNEVALFGSILHPFSAWLMLRGMRTLEVRLRRHEATANLVAGWLETRPEVDRIHHLGLESYPQRELVKTMFRGTGGLFSFEPTRQEPAAIRAFCNRLKLFGRGISWGGFESLVIPMKVCPPDYSGERWLIRLFCGLEDPKDLLADLEAALCELTPV